MFHTTLDAVGNTVRVHYETMKCVVFIFTSTLFRWGEYVFNVCKHVLPAYNSAKVIKNQTSFSGVMITNVPVAYCHVFLWISVLYGYIARNALHS